ncbi:MAG: menaquinol oxidoreductase [Nitrospirae bacterium RBG_19FT_COMBO_42_15]|nr:MAG: menaquinol oxidoreductase [Nitrospirae bacterium RBG_19FT_COMBO_42_15]
MYNSGRIIAGLIIFAAIAASPFYFNMGKVSARPELKLDTPVIQGLTEKQCVESKEYMRANHMQLLNEWRDAVVREGKSAYVSSNGKKYNMSLQNTCMGCHSNKTEFCDRCHKYVSVKPYCWGCHIAPKEKKS